MELFAGHCTGEPDTDFIMRTGLAAQDVQDFMNYKLFD